MDHIIGHGHLDGWCESNRLGHLLCNGYEHVDEMWRIIIHFYSYPLIHLAIQSSFCFIECVFNVRLDLNCLNMGK
jgi:hypothetical protein